MITRADVLQLLNRIDWPENHPRIRPPMPIEVQAFTERTGVTLPDILLEWLRVVNGARIGPGGVFGLQDEDPYASIDLCLRDLPNWRRKQWLPVAGDGCGNFYVFVPEEDRRCVYFIDSIEGYDELCYACASNLWTFLWFLFKCELEESTWPFDREHVVQVDPNIVSCQLAPLPWSAD